ncbi:MAG: AAA family ATPase [Limisphaerales bacterium]
MITKLQFQNFKALKNAELKLGMFNVIIGPNGSGKSSVLHGLEALFNPNGLNWQQTVTAGMPFNSVSIGVDFQFENRIEPVILAMNTSGVISLAKAGQITGSDTKVGQEIFSFLSRIKTFSFETSSLWRSVDSRNVTVLNKDGSNLAGALTHLRDKDEDAYNNLRVEFQRWIPEYDSIGFENDQNGYRQITLRQKNSRQFIPASQASDGTLLALALLTIVHQPTPPALIGLEEPDRGLHPRLLRELRDALYRLSFPSDFGIKRDPVQVVITTHSPFFLDLFKEHPEQVIIAEKCADGTATFKNLSDDPLLQEIIGDAPLGEVWYSGVLGGVPAGT